MNAFFGLEMLVVYFLATGKQSIRILQTVHNDRLECRVRILLYCPGDLMKPVSMFIMCSLPIFFSPKVICVTHGVDLRLMCRRCQMLQYRFLWSSEWWVFGSQNQNRLPGLPVAVIILLQTKRVIFNNGAPLFATKVRNYFCSKRKRGTEYDTELLHPLRMNLFRGS